ncbi:MAG: hypothetical protein COB88_00450 [Flavobacteriales bacterium]|nr:MAG: hypothetical protein COB88_00450 [Flavobacteriales bacterium]
MSSVAFIIKGSIRHIQGIRTRIREAAGERIDVTMHQTTRAGEAILLSERAIRDGANYVIAVGGDGMINEVVNGYMNAPEEIRNKVSLGVFSSGKGNDYVKSLRVSGDLTELFALIKQDTTKLADLGLVEFIGLDGEETKRYFSNITDVGLAGYVTKNIDLNGVFINGFLTYQKAILQAFLTYKHIKVRLESAELNWEGSILSLIMAKGKFFGSGLCIAPHANIDDGKLGLVIIGNISLWDYLMNLGRVKKGIKLDHPEASYHTIGDCKITPLEGECPIDMDGEFIGFAPMKVRVISGAVRFLAP